MSPQVYESGLNLTIFPGHNPELIRSYTEFCRDGFAIFCRVALAHREQIGLWSFQLRCHTFGTLRDHMNRPSTTRGNFLSPMSNRYRALRSNRAVFGVC